MAIETLCSGCGQTLAVPEHHAGQRARCPDCGQIYTVPYPGTSASASTRGSIDSSADLATNADVGGVHPSLAATTAGAGPSTQSRAGDDADSYGAQFWMQTTSGDEYGPVDRTNLIRWFEEGRVGQGYQIRQGENGPWQSAELFQPQINNPYAGHGVSAAAEVSRLTVNSPYSPTAGSMQDYASYTKGDPSGLVLTMGILSWIFFLLGCIPISWIPGLIAWLKGGSGLRDIRNGIADPTNTSLVQVGYYLGMVNVVITLLGGLAIASFIAIATVAGA